MSYALFGTFIFCFLSVVVSMSNPVYEDHVMTSQEAHVEELEEEFGGNQEDIEDIEDIEHIER